LLAILPLAAAVYFHAAFATTSPTSPNAQHTLHIAPSLPATMATKYSSSELRDIGARNVSRPSTALGMYEYELHRAAEHESLFDNAMIQAAKTTKEVSEQHSRLSSLVDTINACATHHKNEHTVSIPGSTHVIPTHMLTDHFPFTRPTLSHITHPLTAPPHYHKPS
jgi:hypothetical protein